MISQEPHLLCGNISSSLEADVLIQALSDVFSCQINTEAIRLSQTMTFELRYTRLTHCLEFWTAKLTECSTEKSVCAFGWRMPLGQDGSWRQKIHIESHGVRTTTDLLSLVLKNAMQIKTLTEEKMERGLDQIDQLSLDLDSLL